VSSKDPDVLPPDAADETGDEDSDAATVASELADDESGDDPLDVDALDSGSDDEGDEDADASDEDLAAVSTPLPVAASQTSALSAYMSQLSHHAPITREEEHTLAVRWHEEGDVQAARQLVLSNLRLVVKIAMEYRRAWTNTLDLIQEGNVGLMEAVQRYDPYQGVKLSSYAVYWIRAYILKYILDNMRSVRLGTTRASRKLFFRLNREKAKLEREGFEVEPRLIAERLDVSENDVLEMEARLSRPDTYLDAPARRDESGGATIGDGFAIGGASAESQVGDEELRRTFLEHVEAFAEDLPEREQRILRERLLADDPRTLADMGEEFGVSRERVRQLEARLLGRLREYLKARMVDFEFYAPPGEE
jgi:RNA polymerase sigma-32 factor